MSAFFQEAIENNFLTEMCYNLIMSETGPSFESPPGTEQGSNPVRKASDGFLARMHDTTKAILFGAVVAEALAVKSFLEGDSDTALAKGILGGVIVAFAVLAERNSRRLDAQSARIRQKYGQAES